jgi:hypothetical protein
MTAPWALAELELGFFNTPDDSAVQQVSLSLQVQSFYFD